MDTAIENLKQLASTGEAGRRELIMALHKLANSLETTNETIHRYGHMNLQTAAVKVGMDLGIFQTLVGSGSPLTVEEISRETGASPQLMTRMLRYLAASGAVDETGKQLFAANHVTKNLAEKLAEAGVSHYFGTVAPLYQTLPAFLKKTGYQNPEDELHTVFQDTWNTDQPVFGWFASHPEHLKPFQDYMALRRHDDASWLDVYPVLQEAEVRDLSKPLYVEVGGGIGHQCAEFRAKYQDLAGRVILQDLPHTIANALPTPGVESMAADFFEPQPVHGAKFYHMRGVLHNHPPHKVRKLLENTRSAMGPDSVLLVDEMVFPEEGVRLDEACIDMAMLAAFASMERTEAQWAATFADAGLELTKVYMYNPRNYETVMEVRLPEST